MFFRKKKTETQKPDEMTIKSSDFLRYMEEIVGLENALYDILTSFTGPEDLAEGSCDLTWERAHQIYKDFEYLINNGPSKICYQKNWQPYNP